MMLGNENTANHLVFTAAQWEELEQQALIYKYMVSGVPVPPHLISSVRTSLYNNSSSSSSSLSNQPTSNFGVWDGSFQYNQLYQIGGGGYGRKIDLEPGRCRRTDGKKWRCSKEAYPDSKYCERHMHRGRNRSRKPVEFSTSSSSSTTATSLNVSVSSSPSTTVVSKSISHSDHAYPQLSSVHTSFMDSSAPYSHPTLKDYRNLQGMKGLCEEERSAYFQLNDAYTTTQKMQSDHQNYSHFNFQNLKEQKKKEEEAQGEHCYVMGTDFIKPSEEATKSSTQKVDETSSKQPFHHFFAPPNTTVNPNWVEVDQKQLINPPKAPLSTQELFQSKPRPYW